MKMKDKIRARLKTLKKDTKFIRSVFLFVITASVLTVAVKNSQDTEIYTNETKETPDIENTTKEYPETLPKITFSTPPGGEKNVYYSDDCYGCGNYGG
jgi:hypothetical protein